MLGKTSEPLAQLTRLTQASLMACIAVPVLYFGAQLAAAPFFPGFSILQTSASALGSDLSSAPMILNIGAALTGVASLAAAWGLFSGLRAQGVWWLLALLFALCSVSFGAASIWAATHPLPDPQHDPGALGVGMFAAPFIAFIVAFQLRCAQALKIYLGLNIVGFGIVACLFAGLVPINLQLYSGAVQRLGALVMLLPSAIIAYRLLKQPISDSAS